MWGLYPVEGLLTEIPDFFLFCFQVDGPIIVRRGREEGWGGGGGGGEGL